MIINFTRLDGTEDTAHITARKVGGYYVGIIRIGTIRKQVTRKKVRWEDAISEAQAGLLRYAENVVI